MEKNKDLRVFAEEIRVETIKELAHLGFGHIGGSMSVVETLAVLYGGQMNYDPKNPTLESRDRLVMSKGHAGPALYATLALKGFFPLERLLTLNQGGTSLPSHCDRLKTPGVDMTTGSLGQGISLAIGLAMGAKMRGKDYTTYLILGDGECDEGQVWEGALSAAHHKLDNLIAFVDWNKQQLDGAIDDVLDIGDIGEKLPGLWLACAASQRPRCGRGERSGGTGQSPQGPAFHDRAGYHQGQRMPVGHGDFPLPPLEVQARADRPFGDRSGESAGRSPQSVGGGVR